MLNISSKNLKQILFFTLISFAVLFTFLSFSNQAFAADPECTYDPSIPPYTWIQTSNFLGYCNADGTLPQERVWNGLIPGYVYIDTYHTSKQYDSGPEICGINTYSACSTSIWGCYKEATYYITGSERVKCDTDGNIIETDYGSCQIKNEIIDKRCDDRNRGCYDTSIPGPNFSLCPDDYLYLDANKNVTCTKDFYTCEVRDYGGDIGPIGYCLANNVCPDTPPPAGTPNFSISLSPAPPALQIDTKGDAVNYTTYIVTLTAIDGFSSSVNLTSPNCPSGATCSFDGGSTVTVSGSPETKILRVADLDNVNANTYTITARGTGGGFTREGTGILQVNNSGGGGACDTNAIGTNQFVSCVWDYPGGDANLVGLYGIDPSYTLKGVGPTSGVSNPADNYSIAYPPDAASGWTFPDRGPAGENDTFLVRFRGSFNFTGGKYDFSFPDATSVDDGAKIVIEDPVFGNREITPYASNDILNSCWAVACNPLTISDVDISAGNHNVTVIFREHQGDARIKLNWTKVVAPVTPGTCSASMGKITRDYWSGIGGNYVTNLTSNSNYPNSPTGTTEPTSFEAPINWANDYGTRMYGVVEAPETGPYTFYIASDDYSELWLSTDTNPSNKVKIAYLYDWANSRQWTKNPTQKSAIQTLTKGQKYYIEAIHKEGGGGDNLAVAWIKPSSSTITVIPGSCLSPESVPAPEDPSNVTTLTGEIICEEVHLSWNTAIGADSYNIYRNTTNSVPGAPYATGVVLIPWVNATPNVSVGTSYYYWVESVAGGVTGPSKVAANTNSTGGASPVACVVSEWSLRVIRSGQGTVTSAPLGINCGATCNSNYNEGTNVVLTATPAIGRRFTGWVGCDSDTVNPDGSGGTCSVDITGDKNILANFIIDPNYREF